MKETNKRNSGLKEFLIKTLCDPVLWYTVLIMTALMYHYRDREKSDHYGYGFSFEWGLAAFLAGWVMFRIFDYMQKHHLIGSAAYMAVFAAFGLGVRRVIGIGSANYPITWMLWFLTPQDSVEYNFWYTLGFFLLFMLFMGSVVYYFTRVRYRIFMNFLIFIIPFAIYGKEYEKMPTMFIILLAVGYILLMVYYRQLRDSEHTVFVERNKSLKTIAAYAVVFAAAAAIIPKPGIEADRSYLETLINAERFTDRLVDLLNVFRDTSSGAQFRSTQDTLVYEVISGDPLRIKTETFSTYDFDKDTWSVEDTDNVFGRNTDDDRLNIGSKMGMADAFLEAASLDSDFAEKYELAEYVENGLDVPEIRQATFFTMSDQMGYASTASTAPVPQNVIDLAYSSRKGKMVRLRGGAVYALDRDFAANERFTFNYSADTFFDSRANLDFVAHLAEYDYRELLEDTNDVLCRAYFYEKDPSEDYEQIFDYFRIDYNLYDMYLEKQLDYGGNKRIKALADELTAGLDSEYEKALKLESYFYNNDYIYSLSYRKARGENAEDFLFETKTGVCYEYATAMVLLARAAGIPARYCEGYNMTKRAERSDVRGVNYCITTQDAHGFPELYLRGYGWVSFEPTVTDNVIGENKRSATDMLSKAGIFILGAALLVLLFSYIYPALSHKMFVVLGKKRSPEDVVRAVMHRLCRVYGIENVNTAQEVCGIVYRTSGADISGIALLFDRAFYGGYQLQQSEKEKALEEYVRAYDLLREAKKNKRRGITDR